MKRILLCFVFWATIMPVFAQEQPVGDGMNDDTAAIQALLDAGVNTVYLPPPPKYYLISKPLRLHSDQTLRLDPNTTVRLADGACQYLLVNDDFENGNKNIQVIGGIWDGNNTAQTCIYHDRAKRTELFSPDKYIGCAMLFLNVKNLRVEKLTIKDSETFGIHIGNIQWFTVQDIIFDCNGKRPNMDGVHIAGNCSQGRVANIQGNTNDDMVALNADDSEIFEISKGPITDIQIDGLFCTNGYTAVRLLSSGDPVKRIRISNIFGSFRFNGVSFTHHSVHPGEPTVFEDIIIDGVFIAKQLEKDIKPEPWSEDARRSHAIVWVASTALVENLSIQNLSRREWMFGAAPTILIDETATVKNLRLRDVEQVNKSETPLRLMVNNGTIDRLFLNSVTVSKSEKEQQQQQTEIITGKENIRETIGNILE
ncbi:MAG: hypothetical protein LBE12_16410 [Planctomycetaceae bacterium]|jgi:hypothetical protein|nr:hypothetical protein [Planctomycetaceae bacterium]